MKSNQSRLENAMNHEQRNERYFRIQLYSELEQLLRILEPDKELAWGAMNYTERLEHARDLLADELTEARYLGDDVIEENPSLDLA